jgi:uncharacterized membrane protein
MKDLSAVTTTALASLLLLGAGTAGSTVHAADAPKMEKCYGVVKAGKNDCQTNTHACAGTATKDGQKDAWIFLPKGTCEKIVGGSLTKK